MTGGSLFARLALSPGRSVESGAIQDDLRHKSIRLVAGLKGDLGRGVSYDASYLFGHVTLDEHLRNLLSISRLGKALDRLPIHRPANPYAVRC